MKTSTHMSAIGMRLPRNSAWMLPAILGVAVILGCATSGINQGQINLISIDEEWSMGQQLEQELAKELKLVNDAQALAYVNRIGQGIVRQSELANRPWEFHIVADPEINAFNIPGGHVYVNTGLIMAADNASELAGVVSHEIAHGVARHATERITASQGINVGAGLLLGQNPSAIKELAAHIAAGGIIAKYSRGVWASSTCTAPDTTPRAWPACSRSCWRRGRASPTRSSSSSRRTRSPRIESGTSARRQQSCLANQD